MKFMNLKRFASTVLAGALALSMAPSALAAGNTTTITGKYEPITLAVTVPNTGSAIINPYGLPINLDEDTVISGEQITTGAPLVISNQSKVALAVTAKVTGEKVGDFDFGATASDVSGKKGLVNFEAFKAPGVLDDTDEAELNTQFAALESADAVLKTVIGTTEATATGTLVLREGTEDGETQDGGAAFVRLSGTIDKTAAWAKEDGFKATVVFSFEPSEYVGNVTITSAGDVTDVMDDGTLALSVAVPSGVKAVASSVKWTSGTPANATVAANTSTTTQTLLTATVTGVSGSATGKSTKISVEFEGNDGVTYKGEITLKVKAS